MKKALLVLCIMLIASSMVLADSALTVKGVIALKNTDDGYAFTLDELEALPVTKYLATDPWMGDKTYQGITLSDIVKYLGVPANTKNI